MSKVAELMALKRHLMLNNVPPHSSGYYALVLPVGEVAALVEECASTLGRGGEAKETVFEWPPSLVEALRAFHPDAHPVMVLDGDIAVFSSERIPSPPIASN